MTKKLPLIIAAVAIMGVLISEVFLQNSPTPKVHVASSTQQTVDKKETKTETNQKITNEKAVTPVKAEASKTVSKTPVEKPTKTLSELSISEITATQKGQFINASGVLEKVTWGKGNTFFILHDTNNPSKKIKCVIFAKDEQKLHRWTEFLKDNRDKAILIHVKGFVDEYNGELEIIVKDVYNL